ncbi:D-alanine--D-alanine ligase [Shewanella gelidii]|uniref:D-alanine--D-alanine ligase n=1 Tax=Shewanella gelidii TaxID=1642821 RepID=A0A917JTW3_9GAMM|nr:D-alanine--D-alanine ligase [Shewanella gelidii]MCL1098590.1 D-alanine--D-alanine ligase [Shewanella gelidii]GGI86853.1 D-alanine--D-alanine ligase [Shewanella gelidii]
MSAINLLLLCGGGSDEHDISLLSAKYFESSLANSPQFQVHKLILDAEGQYKTDDGHCCELTNAGAIRFADGREQILDYVIPCIHGYPGETGDIQSYLELVKLPYFGCNAEASANCFNKITAKMWFDLLDIPNTPFIFLDENSQASVEKATQALSQWGSIFVKAASQGSSVGCYKVDAVEDIETVLQQAFSYSPYVVVEKTILARELEVAVYEYEGEIIATKPGEIVCPSNTFYTFDEKYAADSHAETHVEAPNLDAVISDKIRQYAIKVFKGMKLRHLSRIDFFLTDNNEILLNEINTFPGLTPISMFPKMLTHHGHEFNKFLETSILKQLS